MSSKEASMTLPATCINMHSKLVTVIVKMRCPAFDDLKPYTSSPKLGVKNYFFHTYKRYLPN